MQSCQSSLLPPADQQVATIATVIQALTMYPTHSSRNSPPSEARSWTLHHSTLSSCCPPPSPKHLQATYPAVMQLHILTPQYPDPPLFIQHSARNYLGHQTNLPLSGQTRSNGMQSNVQSIWNPYGQPRNTPCSSVSGAPSITRPPTIHATQYCLDASISFTP